jgi:hypothetical protein
VSVTRPERDAQPAAVRPAPRPGLAPAAGTPSGLAWGGAPLEVWGVRVASAAVQDRWAAALIGQLDTYRRYGVNALTVFYQGSSGGWLPAFSPDGREIDAGVADRMERIVAAAAERRMVVVAGIFYQRARLAGRDAYRRAAELVGRRLAAYDNVIVNVVNEHNGGGWADCPFPVREPDGIAALCQAVRQGGPGLLVGGGGIHPGRNAEIAVRPEVDLVLFDWHCSSEEAVAAYRAAGSTKSLMNVEVFGGWAQGFCEEDAAAAPGRNVSWRGWNGRGENVAPPGRRRIQGVFPPGGTEAAQPVAPAGQDAPAGPAARRSAHRGKRDFLAEVAFAARTPGFSLFGHFPGWYQGPSRDPSLDCRFDLGGQGTRGDPGIRWYFEAVAQVSRQ